MVWVKIHEKFHGKTYVRWRHYASPVAARREVRNWNQFDNPEEHLSILRITKERPRGMTKTPYKGIYRGGHIAKRKRTTHRRRSSGFGNLTIRTPRLF